VAEWKTCKDGRHGSSPKVKLKYLARLLVAALSVIMSTPSISGRDMSQIKENQRTCQTNFLLSWFLLFKVVIIMRMYVNLFVYVCP